MARPKKQTVDYFPHIATNGKTMFILESQFGNDGYAFWFKLLEMLATTDGHVFNCRNSSDWQFLLAKTRMDEVTANKILDLLADLEAIDKELWGIRVIWCQNFVNNIADVYKNRKTGAPSKPDINSFYEYKPEQEIVSTSINSIEEELSAQPTNGNSQSKVKESRVEESKVNNSNDEEKEAAPADDDSNELDPHFFYQNNFGIESPFISQSIEMWIEDLSAELVLEAMKRAVIDQKGFKYAEGIMKKWDAKNIKTLDQVHSDDVAFENQKNRKSHSNPFPSKQPARKEKLPDWAQPGYVAPKETPVSPEVARDMEERLERLRKLQKYQD